MKNSVPSQPGRNGCLATRAPAIQASQPSTASQQIELGMARQRAQQANPQTTTGSGSRRMPNRP